MRVIGCLGLAALLLAAASPAQAEDDGQAWAQLLVQGPIKGDVIFWAEAQTRLTDATRATQILLRPAIGVRLARDTTAHVGYVYVHTDSANGAATNEHRLWQQLSFPILRNSRGLYVWGRSRIEQRMVEGRRDTGVRLRQFVRAQMPLRRGAKLSGVVFVEGFYAANSTDWGARAGFDQVRTFAGVSIPLNKQVNLEPGYLNQTIFRIGPDRVNHVASLNLFVRL
ncbi:MULTISPECIES: DUF2490 domain-containing protein [Sphingomonas]|uniref:DUF2490 domain-containing protein n=1 Tax=Sphingomonas TaxID=13687 RepID=UPI00083582BB|nr:DUF2490 domain-containing protein [Sphingomonas sp. CCH10-B3]